MVHFVTRFAPSPTGFLHLGHAYSALTAFHAARNAGGKFILRIEDIDGVRCKPAFEDAIYEDLLWLGLEWEEPVRRQSEHFEDYRSALDRLRQRDVVYRCFKTRKEIADEIARAPHLSPDGPEGSQYVGAPLAALEERSLMAEGAPFAWRLSMARAKRHLGDKWRDLSFTEGMSGPNAQTGIVRATPEIFGDPVIARKDMGTSYHLACVVDDALQGVTHVIRGADLFPATHLHRLLQALLDLPTPEYRHHKLILDDNGERFAKRNKAASLRILRMAGAAPADIFVRLALPLSDTDP
ncbi:MAG: tRNA glutamyl-Q(34) synthetase GluQRS [Pseudomonadota bacterium]